MKCFAALGGNCAEGFEGVTDIVDRNDVHDAARVGRNNPGHTTRKHLQRPIHHLESGRIAGTGVAHNRTKPERGKRQPARAYQLLGLELAFFIVVEKSSAAVERFLRDTAAPASADMAGADVN